MSAVERQESPEVTRKLTPADLPTFLAMLQTKRPGEWKTSKRTHYRWASADVSEALEILFQNPELAQAFAADALRASLAVDPKTDE